MEESKQRRFWLSPWGYRESMAIVGGIILVGLLLQYFLGDFNFYLLAYPVNLILGAVILLLGSTIFLAPKQAFVRWFCGVPLSVSLLAALLLLSLIMGLTPQSTQPNPADSTFFGLLGFTRMTSSWAFVLVYIFTLLALACLLFYTLQKGKRKKISFYLNHIGFWLILYASGFGYADMERYLMHVMEGETEWRVYDEEGKPKELPIAIQLKDFDMDVYPPKLTLIDKQTGTPLPEDKPHFLSLDSKHPKGTLYQWDVRVEQYIHHAVRSSDSTYKEVPMPGATPAAYVVATKKEAPNTIKKGWVCGGNMAQVFMTLPVDEEHSIVMTVAEPKQFSSDITVYTPNGVEKSALLEVNKPLRVGHWMLYQYGYDNAAGRLSNYSSIELVYDPWLIPVYIGFLLIAIGCFALLWRGNKTIKKN